MEKEIKSKERGVQVLDQGLHLLIDLGRIGNQGHEEEIFLQGRPIRKIGKVKMKQNIKAGAEKSEQPSKVVEKVDTPDPTDEERSESVFEWEIISNDN